MGSKDREKLRVVFKADGPPLDEKAELERLELIKRIHLINNGREVRTIKNKNILEEIVKNLPKNCSVCNSDFSKDNFHLIEVFDSCGAEVYVECLCENYRDVVSKYDGNILLKNQTNKNLYDLVVYVDYRNPDYKNLNTYDEHIKKHEKEVRSIEDLEHFKKIKENIEFLKNLNLIQESLGVHVKNDGKKEVKLVVNKRSLVKVVKNIPKNCPICKSDFSKDNFYLIEIFDGCGDEVYVECLCENYRDVVSEYDG